LRSSDEIRLELVENALDTLFSGVNYSEAEELLSELRRLRQRLGLPQVFHDRFEILEFAKTIHSGQDPRANIERLRSCLTDSSTTIRHKLRATSQLLLIADLTIDADLAEFAFSVTRDLAPNTSGQRACSLFYNTCFGSAEDAAVIAVGMANAISTEPSFIGLLLNAGYAHYRTGNPADALRVLLRAVEIAQRDEMIVPETRASLFLAQVCWSTERIDECRQWYRTLGELVARNADPEIMGEYFVLGARLAIHDGDYDSASRLVDCARGSSHAKLDRPRLILCACQIELRLVAGLEPYSDSELDDFLSLYCRARSFGGVDEVVVSLVRAFAARGRSAEAASLLEGYVREYRRERSPIRSDLARLWSELLPLGVEPSRGSGLSLHDEASAGVASL